MRFVRIYWNLAAGLGTAVIIVTAGQQLIEFSQWILQTLAGFTQ
jgi:hypothetical protein